MNGILFKTLSSSVPVNANDVSSFYENFPYQTPLDILRYINYRNPKVGDSDNMLLILDDFSKMYPMYKLSPIKANILNKAIIQSKPLRILEIGTFFGYSAINILKNIPDKSELICIEANDLNSEVANKLISVAVGPIKSKQFKILQGISTDIINNNFINNNNNNSSSSNQQFDFVFLDHDKDYYLNDLKLLENNNLLSNNCIIVADNILYPGAPGYLEYVGYSNNTSKIDNSNKINNRYVTKLEYAPFERIGFETNWKEVNDAMSITIFNNNNNNN